MTIKDGARLSDIAVGEACRVVRIYTEGGMRRRFYDIGLIPGAEVFCMGASPLGDPRAYLIRGKLIAIRAADARGIEVDI